MYLTQICFSPCTLCTPWILWLCDEAGRIATLCSLHADQLEGGCVAMIAVVNCASPVQPLSIAMNWYEKQSTQCIVHPYWMNTPLPPVQIQTVA